MTGISQPTAYRMLNTLKQFGLVEQQDSMYALGLGMLYRRRWLQGKENG